MDDVIIVGAGHNGLVCACYLAKAGRKVRVLERRAVPGGAVCTEEHLPGYRFDIGSSLHIMIRATPVVEELQLGDFGLEYIEADPWAFFPTDDGGPGILFYRDVEKTCASLERLSPADAEAYRKFVAHWGELNAGVFEVFQKPPTGRHLAATLLRRNLLRPASRRLWSSMETTRQLLMPYGRLINETFVHPQVRAAMAWLAAQSGPAPAEMATGDLLGWNAFIHRIGAWRAKGGSGMLSTALARCLAHHGGSIETEAGVTRISRGDAGGFAVETTRGVFHARRVVAACHVQTTFLDLLDPALLDAEQRRRVENIHVGNGFGMVVRHAVDELPAYPGAVIDGAGGVGECHHGMQLLCPTVGYLENAWHDYLGGRPARDPAVVAMTFSAIDPTLAPPGKHVLFAWAQYHPYELRDAGGTWDEIREREADKIWETICRHAPNMRGKMSGRLIQTPMDLERTLGLRRGNVMHVEMSLDQMFGFRPLPELSSYRTPVDGLFLTGASMHPGGGVFGASGRSTAKVVLRS